MSSDFTNAFDWESFRKREAERLIKKRQSEMPWDWLDERTWNSLIEDGYIKNGGLADETKS